MFNPERLGVGLGLGSLVGGLALFQPWALLGLGLAGFFRLPFLLGMGLVLLRGLLFPPPVPEYGPLVTRGEVRQGLLYTPEGMFHVKPPLEEGAYVLEGRVLPPTPPRLPGGLDEKRWLLGRGVKGVFHVDKVLEKTPWPDWREDFRKRLEEALSPRVARTMGALTLGDKRDLGEYKAFQEAGLAHLLALSGLHVGLLVAFFVLLFFPLGPWRYLLALLGLVFYLFLVGPSPSLLRASLMTGLSLMGLLLGLGRAALLPALGLAFFVQMLIAPWSLLSLGLQLSYLALLGIALILPTLSLPPGPWGVLLDALWGTVAAQAFTLPLLLHHFHLLPLLSPLANLLALPLVFLLVPLGFLKLLLGSLLAPVVEGLARLLLGLTHFLALGPKLSWGEVSPWGFALYYLGLLPLLLASYRWIPWPKALFLTSLPAALSLLLAWPKPVEVLRLGQDAFLFRAGRAEVLVLGEWEKPGEVAKALKALGVEALEVLLLQGGHGHGLRSEFPIGNVIQLGEDKGVFQVGGVRLEVDKGWKVLFQGYVLSGESKPGPVRVEGPGGSWTLPLGLKEAPSLRLRLGYLW
ncbi:MAG: ComEC/Rec2 family competence protein [Thermaceae bacterium]